MEKKFMCRQTTLMKDGKVYFVNKDYCGHNRCFKFRLDKQNCLGQHLKDPNGLVEVDPAIVEFGW